ncbi:MAG: hypothetical protein IJW20_03860 [Clostridia bacterium]|nr:hypothetical protein [Clostridia bacterium]
MEEIDLKELIEMFLEKKFLIIFVVVLFAVLGAVYTNNFITPMYQSSTSLVLVQTGSERSATETSESITTTDLTLNSKLIDAYKVIANSKIVTNTVIKNLKLNMQTEELQEAIAVSSNSEAELVITVKHTNPESACKIANELAKVFKDKVTEIYKVENLYVLDVAETQYEPCNINLGKNIVIFAFVGAVLVAGYILLINMLDTTVKTDSDIERALGIPVLASIVLTGESAKKKNKKSKKSTKKSDSDANIPFSNNVQFFYDNDLDDSSDEKNVSLFSYVNKENLEKNNSNNHKKKGGRK